MPSVRKLTNQEVDQINNKGKGQRKLVEEAYDTILSEMSRKMLRLEPTDGCETGSKQPLGGGDFDIDFKRTGGDIIRFQIVGRASGNGPASAVVAPVAAPEPEPAAAPPKRKGGRPRKTASS